MIVLATTSGNDGSMATPMSWARRVKITRAEPPLAIVGVMPPGVRFLPAFSNADFPNYDINARVDYWIPVTPERMQTRNGTLRGGCVTG